MDRIQAYLDQVFASVPPSRRAAEQKQEMLLDLQDRYRDLLAEGYGREEAYRIVIQGVGDLSELLDELRHEQPYYTTFHADESYAGNARQKQKRRRSDEAPRRHHNALIWVIGLLLFGIFVVLPLGALFAMCGTVEQLVTENDDGLGGVVGDIAGATTEIALKAVDEGILPALDLASTALDRREYSYDDAETYLAASGEITLTDVREIQIDWYGGDIQLRKSSGSELSLVEEAEGTLDSGQALHYRFTDGSLDIRYCAAGRRLTGMPEKTLTLYVPAGLQLEQIEICSAASDCLLQGIVTQELTCATASGDLILDADCRVDTLEYDAVSGALRAQGAFTDIACNNVSGNIEVDSSSTPQDIEICTVSGNVRLLLPAESSFYAALETTSGAFRCEMDGRWQEGKSILVGGGTNDYEFVSVSGNVDICAR